MIEKLMFTPDTRIVSMIQFRDYIVLATEYSVYRLWHDSLTGNLEWHKVIFQEERAPK